MCGQAVDFGLRLGEQSRGNNALKHDTVAGLYTSAQRRQCAVDFSASG